MVEKELTIESNSSVLGCAASPDCSELYLLDIFSEILAILLNRFFSMLNPINEKIRTPRKKNGTNSSCSMSYLMLKNINPAIGKKKNRPKIKLSL
jgi:hypothetical protein